ncbi:hypothetical protein HK105_209342 [Polyrhizophydium stewartii]|uniref:Uncharacterized protein n=1 Tax=Polyrhizophydium stewartii TaxID=2732419 RepID=A0ABR4MVB4_9FUNG|nr:hypothetical protein HK105_002941 [Polyrhizophydium stewartii]
MLVSLAASAAAAAAALAPLAAAQAGCFDTFQPCLEANNVYETTTCVPLRLQNQTMYAVCECYRLVQRDLCYLQCPNNQTVQDERNGTLGPQITQSCAAVSLNPKALPQPPPWQKFGLPSSTSATPAATSAASSAPSPTGATGASGKNAAVGVSASWGALAAGVAAVAAMVLA